MKTKNKSNTVSVYIPKTSRNDEALFVAVNGKRMLVKKGTEVLLPTEFAEVIENSEKAAEQAREFIDSACYTV